MKLSKIVVQSIQFHYLRNLTTKCHLVPAKTGLDGIFPESIFLQFSVKFLIGLGSLFPTGYLSSSYLATDNEALVDYFINKGVSQDDLSFFMDSNVQSSRSNPSAGDILDNLDANLDQDTCHDNLSVPDEALACELPKRRKDVTVQDSMLKARVTLQNLKTLSYNFPDKNVSLANEFTEKLDELYQSFYSQLPNEAGLVILSQAGESIRSTKQREHINRNMEYANLPPRKKYKKSVDSRFGSKANRLRKEANKSKVSS